MWIFGKNKNKAEFATMDARLDYIKRHFERENEVTKSRIDNIVSIMQKRKYHFKIFPNDIYFAYQIIDCRDIVLHVEYLKVMYHNQDESDLLNILGSDQKLYDQFILSLDDCIAMEAIDMLNTLEKRGWNVTGKRYVVDAMRAPYWYNTNYHLYSDLNEHAEPNDSVRHVYYIDLSYNGYSFNSNYGLKTSKTEWYENQLYQKGIGSYFYVHKLVYFLIKYGYDNDVDFVSDIYNRCEQFESSIGQLTSQDPNITATDIPTQLKEKINEVENEIKEIKELINSIYGEH